MQQELAQNWHSDQPRTLSRGQGTRRSAEKWVAPKIAIDQQLASEESKAEPAAFQQAKFASYQIATEPVNRITRIAQ